MSETYCADHEGWFEGLPCTRPNCKLESTEEYHGYPYCPRHWEWETIGPNCANCSDSAYEETLDANYKELGQYICDKCAVIERRSIPA